MSQLKTIRAFKSNVTSQQAMQHFTSGLLNRATNLIRGPVRSIGELYIPYRLFRVRIVSAGGEQGRIFALDAVEGTLDLFEFPSLPGDADLCAIQTRNALPAALGPAQMKEKVIAKVRRIIFAQGFFKVRGLEIKAEPTAIQCWIPYWLCFRGAGETAHLVVLDAVRRKREGAKVRQMIEAWLRSGPHSDPTLASSPSGPCHMP